VRDSTADWIGFLKRCSLAPIVRDRRALRDSDHFMTPREAATSNQEIKRRDDGRMQLPLQDATHF
jgi:hypothetical protein